MTKEKLTPLFAECFFRFFNILSDASRGNKDEVIRESKHLMRAMERFRCKEMDGMSDSETAKQMRKLEGVMRSQCGEDNDG